MKFEVKEHAQNKNTKRTEIFHEISLKHSHTHDLSLKAKLLFSLHLNPQSPFIRTSKELCQIRQVVHLGQHPVSHCSQPVILDSQQYSRDLLLMLPTGSGIQSSVPLNVEIPVRHHSSY